MADIVFPNIITATGPYSYVSSDLGLDTATTNDVEEGADESTVAITGRELLILFNSTGSPIVLTITSVASAGLARAASTAQEQFSISNAETHLIGHFLSEGWADSGGLMRLQAAAIGLRMAVIRSLHID